MIVINCTGSDTLELDELADFQGALKQRSAADINKIIKSIKKHGFSFPFFVWAHDDINHVLDGHGRLAALKKMQADGEEIPALPCVYVEAENEAEAKEKLLKLNSQYGHMTAESVADFLDGMEIELDDLALPDGVLDLSGIAAPEEETEGDDDAPDVDENGEPDSQPGEMYELGNSILLCGSATEKEDVLRLTDGKKIPLVLTDPPYGIDVVQGNSVGGSKPATFGTVGGEKVCKVHTYEKIIGDDTTETAEKSYNIYSELSDNQIIFGGNYFTDFLMPSKCWCVWDKENTGNFADVELAWTSFDKGAKLYKWLWNGMSRKGNRTDEGKTRVHPTQKPAGMLAEIIKDFSKEGDFILDVFGGSGSTLIACEMTNRKCLMLELSPHYCDVIRKRWTKWAQKNGRKVGSGGLE